MHEFDLDALADWLDEDHQAEACFDIHGLHGYITALAICAEPLTAVWLEDALARPMTDEDAGAIAQCQQLYQQVCSELYSDDQVAVTFEPDTHWQDSPMQSWCEGFMEVVIALPERWTHSEEDALATALLPIEVASGLFADEADFRPLYRNPKLLREMFDQIPELLTDLYLLLQSPDKG
ncbi:MAG: YecA/YgfB family protein [Saccharospirillum sp.]